MISFSLLISIYIKEKAKFFAECLDSLVNQTVQANEVVLVLDGPLNADLYQVIEEYKLKLPLKIISLTKNIGLGKALNEGLKNCSYKWIFRMDADDICLPDRFEKQIAYIQNNPHICLLGGQITEFNETFTNIIGKRTVPLSNSEIKRYALTRNPFNHMTVGYKKETILAVGGYQHHLYMEDYNLWLRVIAQGYSVGNLPDILVNVRSGNAMYKRRTGLKYIASEFLLANLKINLKLQSLLGSYFSALVRIIPRLLPSRLLGKIYNFLRSNEV